MVKDVLLVIRRFSAHLEIRVNLLLMEFAASRAERSRAFCKHVSWVRRTHARQQINRLFRCTRNRVRRDLFTKGERRDLSAHIKRTADAARARTLGRIDPRARRIILDSLSLRDRKSAQASSPPALAEYLLELLASPEWSEAAAGDFFEKHHRKFCRVRDKHGALAAKADYWWQVVRSAPGLLRIRFRHLAALAGIAKVFAVIEKWTAK